MGFKSSAILDAHRTGGIWRRTITGLTAAALVFSGIVLTMVPQAQAANVQLQSINVTVAADGTNDGPNGQVMVNGVALDHVEGMDDDHNGLIAVQDIVTYRITAYYAAGTTAADTLSMVGTLPTGATWQPTSYSADSCTVSGAGYNGKTSFTCKWAGDGNTEKVFTWYALVVSPPFKNGDILRAEFKDGNGGSAAATSPDLTVVSTPAIDIAVTAASDDKITTTTYNGQPGFEVMESIYIGSWRPKTDSRGLEASTTPYTFDVQALINVPNNVSNAILVGDNSNGNDSKSTAGDGATATQDSSTGIIHVTVPTSMIVPSATASSFMSLLMARIHVTVFVPYSVLPADTDIRVTFQAMNFDPEGLSSDPPDNIISNYGNGVAPGQESGALCKTSGQQGENCSYRVVNRRTNVALLQYIAFANDIGAVNGLFAGQGDVGTSYKSGEAIVVPGQSFVPVLTVSNNYTAGAAMTAASSCITWDPSVAVLQGSVRVGGVAQFPSGITSGPNREVVAGAELATADYVLEYASSSSLMPGSPDCWVTDNGVLWTDSLADSTVLPSGVSSVNAIRLKLNVPLQPSDAIGLSLPMRRTASSLTTGSSITFYNSQTADQITTPAKINAYVVANDALVRATTTATPVTSSAGKSAIFTVTPTVIGPAANVDTIAVDTKLQLTFDSACVDVSAAVAALQTTYGTGEVSVDYGDALSGCASGSTLGPVITIILGNIPAPGSAVPQTITNVSGVLVGGNETYIGSPISIPVFFSTLAPNGTVHMETIISSDSDTSVALSSGNGVLYNPGYTSRDRTSWAMVTLNTAEGFTVEKLVSTNSSGLVNPGETFSYTLYAANTMLGDYGVTSLVDVLPFPGDPRLNGQTDGLVGTDGLQLVSASGVMYDAVNDQDVDLDVYCSSADPAAAYNDLAGDASTAGDFAGQASLFNWQLCSSLSSLGQVTAVKFATQDLFVSKASITATVTVKAPGLSIGGHIVNDMAYLAPAPPAGGLPRMRRQRVSFWSRLSWRPRRLAWRARFSRTPISTRIWAWLTWLGRKRVG